MREWFDSNQSFTSEEKSFLSQSDMNRLGVNPRSLLYCWNCFRMSVVRLWRGYMDLYLVARSTRYNAYLAPP